MQLDFGFQETCILLPQIKAAFDIGRCPQRAVSHQHLFITHGACYASLGTVPSRRLVPDLHVCYNRLDS
jgi:hypothetical protein